MYCWLLHIVCMYQEKEKLRALCENTTWVVMRLLSGGQPPSVNSKNANLLVSDILKCHFQIFRSDPPSLSLVFLPFRIGRNPDSTEFTKFTRPLSGSVRLINRHCPGTVTSATNALLSLVSSYILPQIALFTRWQIRRFMYLSVFYIRVSIFFAILQAFLTQT